MRRPDFHLRRYQLLQMAGDALLVALAYFLAFQLRFIDDPGTIPDRYVNLLVQSIGFVIVGKISVFYLFGLYQKWWRFVGGRDVARIVQAVSVSSLLLIVLFTVVQPFPHDLPRTVAVTDFLLTLFLIAGARLGTRLFKERPNKGNRIARGREVLVVGAGSGGQMVVRELRLNPHLGETAIGFVDDNKDMRGMRIQGISVLGTTSEIETILDETEPDEVMIAIPSAPGTLRAQVVAACRARQIRVRTLPTVFELLRGGVQLSQQLREVQVEDVLGREPVVVELARVGAYLEDQVVMVTGAGGSIGKELCRQIALVGPKLLVMLDHAEDNLFQIEREMVAERHFSRVEAVLADCKEADRMFEVMQRFRPKVVFHAAAYKHVPLMESNPLEAVRNNAFATRITSDTAAAAGAERFVLISTDKAVNPQTVMGASKAMAEWAVSAADVRHPGTRFVSVRFGNVLGSSGSVVPIFKRQIEQGGPLTVTHPDMTRFFMTIPEAVQLVIRAGDTGVSRGDVFVLDMGEPVKITDLAENMIKLAGREPETDIAIEFTGVRPGEKLHEELFGPQERPQSTASKRIMRAVREHPIDPDWIIQTLDRLDQLVQAGDEADLAEKVVDLAANPGSDPIRVG
ncbi:MAG: polysaccharide biosynthesis protein [Solirubrobacterales bacterium]|nr:polysaccharide biosynthesis protein [Solirubrobacterales bacterium]HMT04389.1 nucleoside-diphosphate sugar epimerase/dehydratase [Solirubrobacterales bacterium]